MTRRSYWICLALALAACGDGAAGGVEPPDESGLDEKGDRAGPTFRLIRSDVPFSASERSVVIAALKSLQDTGKGGSSTRQKKLAAETVARVGAGQVLLGSLASARGMDLWHMCQDLESPGRNGCPALPVAASWAGDATMRAALAAELDGYMWGNRLYLRLDPGHDPKVLAGTLAHEVNHVLNRSECWYYADYFAHEVDETLAWLEEYRAFLAECVLKRGSGGTTARCDDYALAQLEERDYGFTPDLGYYLEDTSRGSRPIAEALFADDGQFGVLVPITGVWPRDFSECESL